MIDKEISEKISEMVNEIRDKVDEMLEEIRDLATGEIDIEKGKEFWPIKDGDCPSVRDAYKTLYSLSDATLELTFYDETGNNLTNVLSVVFMNIYGDRDSVNYFARLPLKELLEREIEPYIEESNTTSRHGQLLARLIKAFEEPA